MNQSGARATQKTRTGKGNLGISFFFSPFPTQPALHFLLSSKGVEETNYCALTQSMCSPDEECADWCSFEHHVCPSFDFFMWATGQKPDDNGRGFGRGTQMSPPTGTYGNDIYAATSELESDA